MVKYICEKCNKKFHKKQNYDIHINRKTDCSNQTITDNELICKKCNKEYKHHSSLYRHVKKCKNSAMDPVNNILHDNRKIIDNSTNTKIDTQNNMNVDNVKLVKFGDENLSYISDDLFKSILGRGFKSVGELIDHSHFHPDHPENHNIYIANIRNDYVVIYDGKKWNINKKEDVFEDIIYAKSDFLCMKFKELMSQMTEMDIKKFTNFINQRDEDQTMNKIKGELKLQLYNNRYLPERLRKQMESTERLLLKDLNKKQPKRKKNTAMASLDNIMNMLDGVDESKVKDVEALLNKILV